ncbi:MAG: trypsin-like peptidase domain-containing protein, partial [Myxococcota bacterium]
GDSVRLELFTTQPSRPFVIDRYAAGEAPELGPQAICGSDDKRGAACYRESHPEEYSNVRAVARLLTNGRGFCTGWLVGPDNLLLTNNHCIGSAESALNTDYEFMAETSECDGSTAGESRIFSGGELLATSVPLDYSLIRVNGTPSDEFGYLEIDDRVARVGEPIYIAGHPGGRRKEMTLESTHPEDLNRIPRVFSISESPCTGTGFNDVGYYGDTEGGSSGSPVIAQETQGVIALHHCANCPNRGVPIHLVVDEIEDFLVNSEGRVAMNRQTLACGGSFEVRVSDRDLEGEPSETITVFTSAGDSEIVELDALGGGIFRGTLSISGGTPFRGDSMIQAGHGDVVTARYTDKNDGNGGARDVEDSLTVDCVAPVISEVASDPRAFSSVVQVITDEAASVNVRFGESCSDLSASVSGALSKEHYVLLDELDPSTRYFFALEARDDAGNLATDDNFGECFE